MNNEHTQDGTDDGKNLGISDDLLAILACPVDHCALDVTTEGLRCTTCGCVYLVAEGIPNFVVDD